MHKSEKSEVLISHCPRHEHTQAAIHLQEGGVLTMYEVPRQSAGLDTQHWPWPGHGGHACRRDSQSTKPSTSTLACQALERLFQLLIVTQQHSHSRCGLMSGSSHAVPPLPMRVYQPGLQEAPRPARNAGVRAAWAGRLCRDVCM